jgi:hypothetical protein
MKVGVRCRGCRCAVTVAACAALKHACARVRCVVMSAVDECGVCTGTSDCPLVVNLLFDYPYVSSDIYDASTLESKYARLEILETISDMARVPLDRITLEQISPQGAASNISMRFVVNPKGYAGACSAHTLSCGCSRHDACVGDAGLAASWVQSLATASRIPASCRATPLWSCSRCSVAQVRASPPSLRRSVAP